MERHQTTLQRSNEGFLTDVVNLLKSTDSALFTLDEAVADCAQLRKKEVKSMPVYRGPMAFGPHFAIPVIVFPHIMELKFPSLKQFELKTAEDGTETWQPLTRQTSYHVDGEESDGEATEAIEGAERIKAFKYGKSKIHMDDIALEQAALPTKSSLEVLGFLPNTAVPVHYFLSNTLVRFRYM
jgi:hypothetical protein